MSVQSDAMEQEVRAIRTINMLVADEARQATVRERIMIDRHFAALQDILASRIRHLTRTYGLMDMTDDAQQVCAIAIHRAIAAWEPEKSRFTTFVTWQLRGELQSLRHRMRLDQRESARNAGIRTVSIEQQSAQGSDDAFTIVDEAALIRTESGASRILASRCANALLDGWEQTMRDRDGGKSDAGLTAKLKAERAIVNGFLFHEPRRDGADSLTAEQKRQITRRVLRHCSGQVQSFAQLR